jgi:hypothetical protein
MSPMSESTDKTCALCGGSGKSPRYGPKGVIHIRPCASCTPPVDFSDLISPAQDIQADDLISRLTDALAEARRTLSLARGNIMVEMSRSEGAAYRFEGVPEILQQRIADCDDAIGLGDAATAKATAQ